MLLIGGRERERDVTLGTISYSSQCSAPYVPLSQALERSRLKEKNDTGKKAIKQRTFG